MNLMPPSEDASPCLQQAQLSQARPKQSKRAKGNIGEALAAQYLKGKGYCILTMNWRHGRQGEIDIIATQHAATVLVFVEVKTRSSLRYGAAIEAVTPRKQQQILTLAAHYLSHLDLETLTPETKENKNNVPPEAPTIRFDVIGIQLSKEKAPEITHLENAFEQ